MKRITSVLLGIVLMAGLSFATVLAADTTIVYTKKHCQLFEKQEPYSRKKFGRINNYRYQRQIEKKSHNR